MYEAHFLTYICGSLPNPGNSVISQIQRNPPKRVRLREFLSLSWVSLGAFLYPALCRFWVRQVLLYPFELLLLLLKILPVTTHLCKTVPLKLSISKYSEAENEKEATSLRYSDIQKDLMDILIEIESCSSIHW